MATLSTNDIQVMSVER